MKKRRFKRTSWLRFFLLLVSISLLIVVFRTPILSFLQLGRKESLHRSPLTAAERIRKHAEKVDTVLFMMQQQRQKNAATRGTTKHRIYSVHTFEETFPDLNPIQLATAKVLGIPSIKNRADAELHKGKLVCIEQHTDYHVNHLTHSIPYLIPRAARLLEAIAAAYTDSLQAKGLPSYQLVVTSVLRTEEDIAKLRGVNRNASEQSCHRYGTTFDISYNQFIDTRTKKKDCEHKAQIHTRRGVGRFSTSPLLLHQVRSTSSLLPHHLSMSHTRGTLILSSEQLHSVFSFFRLPFVIFPLLCVFFLCFYACY